MKTTLLILSTLLFQIAYSQELYEMVLPINSATDKIEYTDVITVENTGQETLFNRAKDYFNTYYTSEGSEITSTDLNSFKIIGKTHSDLDAHVLYKTFKTMLRYTLTLETKDNKYRYIITNIDFLMYPSDEYPNPYPETAEKVLIDEFYKDNGKIRKSYIPYKEHTIRSIENEIKKLKEHMNSELTSW